MLRGALKIPIREPQPEKFALYYSVYYTYIYTGLDMGVALLLSTHYPSLGSSNGNIAYSNRLINLNCIDVIMGVRPSKADSYTNSNSVAPSQGPDSPRYTAPSKQLDPQFQDKMTDMDWAMLYGKTTLAGWEKCPPKSTNKIMGIVLNGKEINYAPTGYRICNEKCVEFGVGKIFPLVHITAQSSNITSLKDYRDWNQTLDDIIDALIEDYYGEGDGEDAPKNEFEIRRHRIPTIITFLGGFSTISAKGIAGFFTKEMSDTMHTEAVMKLGGDPGGRKEGAWDKLMNIGRGR